MTRTVRDLTGGGWPGFSCGHSGGWPWQVASFPRPNTHTHTAASVCRLQARMARRVRDGGRRLGAEQQEDNLAERWEGA